MAYFCFYVVGTLNIYIASDSGKKTLLWSVGGQRRLRWTKAQIDLQPQPQYQNVQISIILTVILNPHSNSF